MRLRPGPVARLRGLTRDLAAARDRLDRLERRLASVRVGVREERLLLPPTQEDVDRLTEDVLTLLDREAERRTDRSQEA